MVKTHRTSARKNKRSRTHKNYKQFGGASITILGDDGNWDHETSHGPYFEAIREYIDDAHIHGDNKPNYLYTTNKILHTDKETAELKKSVINVLKINNSNLNDNQPIYICAVQKLKQYFICKYNEQNTIPDDLNHPAEGF